MQHCTECRTRLGMHALQCLCISTPQRKRLDYDSACIVTDADKPSNHQRDVQPRQTAALERSTSFCGTWATVSLSAPLLRVPVWCPSGRLLNKDSKKKLLLLFHIWSKYRRDFNMWRPLVTSQER